jgi:amino acid transporter
LRSPGSGIFSSPGVLLSSTGSPGAALLVWVASGLLAWSGASSYIELGAAIPVNGGSQAYLNCQSSASSARRQTPALTLLAARPADAYGPLVAYMFSWTAVSLLKPGSAAIIALIFGEYVMRLVYSSSVAPESADGEEPVSTEAPEWTFKLLGCISELFGLTRAAASLTTDTPPVVPDPVILVVTAINIANARAGAHVQVGLTSIKVRTRLGSLLAPF